MKKFVLLCSMTGLVSLCSYAQNNVGINTTTPKSTLDVEKATTFAIGDQAGITFPRLTGNEIKSMSLTGLKTGTVVYATDSATGIVAGTAHAAKITTSGFYFYDGAKWEPFTFGSNQGEWVYNPTSKKIELIRSNVGVFNNSVYYDSLGNYYNIDSVTDILSINVSGPPDTLKLLNSNGVINEIFHFDHYRNAYEFFGDTITRGKSIRNFYGILNGSDTFTKFAYLNNNVIRVPTTNNNNYTSVYSSIDQVHHNGNGTITNILGGSSAIYVRGNGGVTGLIAGELHEAQKGGSGTAGNITASTNRVYVYGTGSVNSAIGTYNLITNPGTGNANVGSAYGTYNIFNPFYSTSTVQYNNVYGMYDYGYRFASQKANTTTKRYYGLYLESVTLADSSNYAIYTNLGKNSFGDVTEIRKSDNTNYTLQVINNADITKGLLIKGGDGSEFSTASGSSIRVLSNTSTRPAFEVQVRHGGRVGIGTDNPSGPLDIVVDNPLGENGDNIQLTSYSGINYPSLSLTRYNGPLSSPVKIFGNSEIADLQTNGYNGTVLIPTSKIITRAEQNLDISGKTSMEFQNNNGSALETRLIIKGDGNIGIGVDIPTAKLEVNGKIKAVDVNFSGLPVFNSDAAATTLTTGDMYRTTTGELRIKL